VGSPLLLVSSAPRSLIILSPTYLYLTGLFFCGRFLIDRVLDVNVVSAHEESSSRSFAWSCDLHHSALSSVESLLLTNFLSFGFWELSFPGQYHLCCLRWNTNSGTANFDSIRKVLDDMTASGGIKDPGSFIA